MGNSDSPNDSARWKYACGVCDWIGNEPTVYGSLGIGAIADCPECGSSCTSDEETFEPRPGVRDGTAEGFDPEWPRLIDTDSNRAGINGS